MSILCYDEQLSVVVNQLQSLNGMSRDLAMYTWMNSKTRKFLLDNNLNYVSGMRCYWELCLELKNDNRWLRTPFDF